MSFPPQSIPLTGAIGTTAPEDVFPTHYDSLGSGGMRAVATLVARDAIPVERRVFGMFVFVIETGNLYYLANGQLDGSSDDLSDNSNWQEFSPGSGDQGLFVAEETQTTSLLEPGEYQDFSFEFGSVYQLLSIESSSPCWFRLYGKSSARDLDTRTEPGGTPPGSGSDFYTEIVTTELLPSIRLSPIPTVNSWYGTTFARVVNTGTEAAQITLAFKYLAFVPSEEKLDVSFLLEPAAAPNTELNFQGVAHASAAGLHAGSDNPYWLISTAFDEDLEVVFVDGAYELSAEGALFFQYFTVLDSLDPSLDLEQLQSAGKLLGVIPQFTFELIFRASDEFADASLAANFNLNYENLDSAWSLSMASPGDNSLSLIFGNLFNPDPSNVVSIPSVSFESPKHLAAVYFEDKISFFVGGEKMGEILNVPPPEFSEEISTNSGVVVLAGDDYTGSVRTAVKGIRFTPRALYFEDFTPPETIDTLIPEFTY
jgi:hypothetical protein